MQFLPDSVRERLAAQSISRVGVVGFEFGPVNGAKDRTRYTRLESGSSSESGTVFSVQCSVFSKDRALFVFPEH